MILKIPNDEPLACYQLMKPNTAILKAFLLDNDYIVTNTDKNLVITVSHRTWLHEKCLDPLNNENNYKMLHLLTPIWELDNQCIFMEEIACLTRDNLTNAKQLDVFFQHLIEDTHKKRVVPRFYGIPKIHKEPIKFHPIILCHSAVQNPAKKYVSKRLKLIIESVPTIIHGTKDLAIKLSKLKLTDQKYFIVTSDVVAFYPSIPIENCIDITLAYFKEFYYRKTDKNNQGRLIDTLIFIKAFCVANTKLIFIPNNQMYEQK